MRKRVFHELEQRKLSEQARLSVARRRIQSLAGVKTVAAPSAGESRKHMKVISVARTGPPTLNNGSVFSLG